MSELVLSDPLTPADVAAVCERGHAQLEAGDADVLVCDVGALARPGAAAVDALARLALTARRMGRDIRFVGASQELRLLVDLCGLAEVLFAARGLGREPGGEPEQREQPLRVEERVERRDPPV
jgi:anti-anti-sigma regulatory factor